MIDPLDKFLLLDFNPLVFDRLVLNYLCHLAAHSPDTSSQNAACLVDPETPGYSLEGILSDTAAVNAMPVANDDPVMWEHPGKYERVKHAETGALVAAARSGIKTAGMWLYAPWASCGPCASLIIAAGITRVVTLASSRPDSGGPTHDRWSESIRIAYDLFDRAGLRVVFVDGPVTEDGFTVLRNGTPFHP